MFTRSGFRLQSPQSGLRRPHQGARPAVCTKDRIVTRTETGQKTVGLAAGLGLSVRTVRLRLVWPRADGRTALVNRASVPARVAEPVPDRMVTLAPHLRRSLRLTWAEIARRPGGLARSTVARWLARNGTGRKATSTGRATASAARTGAAAIAVRAGVHVAIDGATRLAYVGVLTGERRDTTGLPRRAPRWFHRQGIGATETCAAHRSRHSAKALRWPGIRHILTRPFTPKTNGTAHSFRQTFPREGACGLAQPGPDARTADPPRPLAAGLTGTPGQDCVARSTACPGAQRRRTFETPPPDSAATGRRAHGKAISRGSTCRHRGR